MAHQPEFFEYQQKVLRNAQTRASVLVEKGYQHVSGGTENHLMLFNHRPKDIDGAHVDHVLELAGIALKKNTFPGDKSAFNPGGIRMGTHAMTTRGYDENDFKSIANFLNRGASISKQIKDDLGSDAKIVAYRKDLDESTHASEISALKKEVEEFALGVESIGFDRAEMVYP